MILPLTTGPTIEPVAPATGTITTGILSEDLPPNVLGYWRQDHRGFPVFECVSDESHPHSAGAIRSVAPKRAPVAAVHLRAIRATRDRSKQSHTLTRVGAAVAGSTFSRKF
jgi:hypothetical protein